MGVHVKSDKGECWNTSISRHKWNTVKTLSDKSEFLREIYTSVFAKKHNRVTVQTVLSELPSMPHFSIDGIGFRKLLKEKKNNKPDGPDVIPNSYQGVQWGISAHQFW